MAGNHRRRAALGALSGALVACSRAVFFLAIGLSVDPSDLLPVLPVLPVAILLAVATALTKIVTGW